MSSEEIDIGVEVHPDYRGRGIAAALIQKMCAEAISQGKKPVWAHAETNTGSMHTIVELKSTEDGYPLYRSVGFVDGGSRYHMMKWENQ